ncbi:MAG: thiamine phosphate synthase [Acidobacteriota bacterium]
MIPRRRPQPSAIYGIADVRALAPTALPDAVEELADAGLEWIQLRWKEPDDRRFYDLVAATLERLEGRSVALWIDDRADLAALFPVAGVHVGQRDLPPAAVRRVVGPDCWIGQSTHDLDQVRRAHDDPDVDVVALGPIFPTVNKQNPDPVVGLDGLRQARAATDKPLVAIGGIDADRLPEVLAAGADSAAVLGAVTQAPRPRAVARLLAAATAAVEVQGGTAR